MNRNTLYISDLDGTLLGTDSRISARSAEIISDLSRRGALITVATARTPATVVPLMADTFTTVPAIVMTGSGIWDRAAGKFLKADILSPQQASAAGEITGRHGITPFFYTLPDSRDAGAPALEVYHSADSLTPIERQFVDARIDRPLKRFYLSTQPPRRCLDRTMLIFGMGDTDRIEAAANELKERTDCYVSHYPDIFNPAVGLIEIYATGVSKASAARSLAESLGAGRIVAFGDNLNDLSLLRAADMAVAVGNALPQVREAADAVIGENYTDAVARFIAADFEKDF